MELFRMFIDNIVKSQEHQRVSSAEKKLLPTYSKNISEVYKTIKGWTCDQKIKHAKTL